MVPSFEASVPDGRERVGRPPVAILRRGSERRPVRRAVCILCPGGLEHAGGIGRAMGNLLGALDATDPKLPIELIDTRGPGHIAFSPLYLARALVQIAALGISGRLGLLHVNIAAHGSTVRKLAISLLAAALDTPVILHVHSGFFGDFYHGLPRSLQAVVRWMFQRAQRVVVLGECWKQLVVTDLGIAPERVQVIYNGVRRPAVAPTAVETHVSRPLHLLFIGRLCHPKGVGELVTALAAPSLRGLRWRATFAGDGDSTSYSEQATQLGIADRIAFPGWLGRRDVERLLAEADILALPSHAEGLPVAVLEAMANQVPVVATPVGSLPEFLTDSESVLFVPPRDADALAGALRQLMVSPALRARLAAGGREVFSRHFDIETVTKQVLALYREIAPGLWAGCREHGELWGGAEVH